MQINAHFVAPAELSADWLIVPVFEEEPLSGAAAELGHESQALTHGEQAYRMAKTKVKGSALQPFAQNYVNVLRQFGQDGLATRIQKEEAALGVR